MKRGKKIFELLATPFGGLLSVPFVVSLFALYALMFHVGYTKLAQPIGALYGRTLPDVPGWQWVALLTICYMIKNAFAPAGPTPDSGQIWRKFIGRLGAIFSSIFIALLINWIWL